MRHRLRPSLADRHNYPTLEAHTPDLAPNPPPSPQIEPKNSHSVHGLSLVELKVVPTGLVGSHLGSQFRFLRCDLPGTWFPSSGGAWVEIFEFWVEFLGGDLDSLRSFVCGGC